MMPVLLLLLLLLLLFQGTDNMPVLILAAVQVHGLPPSPV
jgi:hypothetical protein